MCPGLRTQGLCFRPRNLDARLGFDLCTDEQDFLQNRRKVVAAALKDVLHLEEDLQEHEVTRKGTAGGFFSLLSLKPGDEE